MKSMKFQQNWKESYTMARHDNNKDFLKPLLKPYQYVIIRIVEDIIFASAALLGLGMILYTYTFHVFPI